MVVVTEHAAAAAAVTRPRQRRRRQPQPSFTAASPWLALHALTTALLCSSGWHGRGRVNPFSLIWPVDAQASADRLGNGGDGKVVRVGDDKDAELGNSTL
jgi:hypothetical protein